jgi:streptogramin lyase
MKFRSLTLVAVLGAFLFAASTAQAAPTVTGIYDLPATPVRSVLGPDAATWITLDSGNPDIARVAPDGTVKTFNIPAFDFPLGIAVATDGELWVSGNGYVGHFLTTNPLAAQRVDEPTLGATADIAPTTNGSIWVSNGSELLRVRPGMQPLITHVPLGAGVVAKGLSRATDNRLWVADANPSHSQLIPVYDSNLPGLPVAMTSTIDEVFAGTEGQIAFAGSKSIGLKNLGNAFILNSAPAAVEKAGLAYAADKAFWFAQPNTATIGRLSAAGEYASIGGFPSGTRRVTRGVDDTLWVLCDGNKIARVSGLASDLKPRPTLSHVSLTNKRFRVAAFNTPLTIAKKRRTPSGTKLKFLVYGLHQTTIQVQKPTGGGRYETVMTLNRKTVPLAASMTVAFSGRMGAYKLKPGRYRFLIFAMNDLLQRTNSVTKPFTIVK